MSKLRFVLDTNLIVSTALLERSTPRQAFELAFNRGELLLSDAMLAELSGVLRRDKFGRRYGNLGEAGQTLSEQPLIVVRR